MRILILLLLLTGTVLQSEPKNIYAEEAYQDGDDCDEHFDENGNYIAPYNEDEDEDEPLAEKKPFTKEEEAEIEVLITSMVEDILEKVINLGADEFKDRKMAHHVFTLYIHSIINPEKETKNYKYRYEQLKCIMLIIVNSYKQTDDIELKFGLLEMMELTFYHIQYQDLKDYAKKSYAYGSDVAYIKQMIDIYFEEFLEKNKIKRVIDLDDEIDND